MIPYRSARVDSGAVFFIRTTEELAALEERALLERLRYIKSMMAPDAGGMDYARTIERRIAMRERRQLEAEYSRRCLSRSSSDT